MILSDIKKYVQENKRVSLADVSIHFDVDPSAAEEMLDHWVKKNAVRKIDFCPPENCGGCSCDGCGSGGGGGGNGCSLNTVYEWTDG